MAVQNYLRLVFISVLPVVFVTSMPSEIDVNSNSDEGDVTRGSYSPFRSNKDVPLKRLEINNFKTETRKQEKTKEMNNKLNTTFAPNSGTLGDSSALYRLNADGGSTCILMKVDALVQFNYLSKLAEAMEKDTYVLKSASVDGQCTDEDRQSLVLKWKSFVLIMYFSKTPGGERWFVSKMEVKFNSADQFFEHIKNPGRSYTLSASSSHGQLLFPTPVGKSYRCERDIGVVLTSAETDTTATVLLRDMQLEPFIFKNDEFGPEYKCSATGAGSYRSETAPLVVGSLLAAACLLTIIGYSVYRYFNIEKVQYDTME